MGLLLEVGDLRLVVPSDVGDDRLVEAIMDAEALVFLVAPCLRDSTDADVLAAARAIVRRAIARDLEAGSGALTQRQQTAGQFSLGETVDTRQQRRGLFAPWEESQLRDLCNPRSSGRAFQIDTTPVETTAESIADYPAYWFQWVTPTPPGAP